LHLCNISIIPERSAARAIKVKQLCAAPGTVVGNNVSSQCYVRYASGIQCSRNIRVVFVASMVDTDEKLNWTASSNQKLTNIVSRVETIPR
jgi:hypothetical protein